MCLYDRQRVIPVSALFDYVVASGDRAGTVPKDIRNYPKITNKPLIFLTLIIFTWALKLALEDYPCFEYLVLQMLKVKSSNYL